ncbi:hypothetical protein B0J11DRAFT_16333 [Dendryphion nanum]|uniref:Mid2 domain-containing protein n=1 Tax=Dendryphion nanum TaxID=256645 RepID=A0A9P9EKF2_9PLEO|nr:hypothetical protein B0J11DRAFT_16333 [Dendryphion nanum]
MFQALVIFVGYIASWVLLLQVVLVPTVDGDCYAYDGVFALNSKYYTGQELVSCGNGTNNCCLKDEKCGTNLLCVNPKGGVTRQYCANKDWSQCSTMCVNLNPNAGLDLTDCGRNVYCCGSGNFDCCRANRGFYVDPNNGNVRIAASGEFSISTAASPTWWTVDSTSILRIPATTPGSSVTTLFSTLSSTSVPTSTFATTSTSTATSTAITNPNSSGGISAGAGAGIGVGGAVVVVGGIVLGWYILRKRRKQRELQAQTVLPPHPYPYHDNSYQADLYTQKTSIELRQQEAPTELAAPNYRHELK